MAVYYFRNVNGNWGTAANWSLSDNGPSDGAVPTSADDAYFTSNSGNCTVAATSACKTLICAGVGAGDYTGTFTLNALLDVFGTITLSSGMTLAGTNQLRLNTTATLTSAGKTVPWAILWGGTAQTYTLADNWNFSGNISFTATTSLTINSNQIISTATVNIGAAGVSGTTTIIMAGTGAIQGAGTVACNLNINSPSGTITIGSAGSPNLRFNTNTLTYTAGTIAYGSVTGGLSIQGSCTLNTSGMTWQNVVFNGANTTTLTSDLNISGAITVSFATVINGAGRTVNVGGNLTINQATSGTATIQLTGTGTWSTTGFNLNNNLIFNNGANSFTVSGTVYYITGTMTYTSGTIVTTSSTLFTGTCTLNTNGINWVNLSATNATVTMTSNLNITGTFSNDGNVTFTSSGGSQLVTSGPYSVSNNATSPSSGTISLPNIINVTNFSATLTGNLGAGVNLNGSGVNISGNITVAGNDASYGLRGTTTLNLVGTGTISSATVGGGNIYCAININTTGTITLGTFFNTGSTITYTQGTFITTNSAVWIRTGTFTLNGFDNIFWDCAIRTGFDVFTPNYTLNSNLNCRSFNAGGTSTAIGSGVINCNALSINNNVCGCTNIGNVFNTDVNVYGTATFGTGGSTFIIGTAAGKAINVYGDLVLSAPTTIYGDATVKMLSTGTITSVANFRQFDLIIDTPGNITIANTLYWNTGATSIAGKGITYLRGNVIVPKSAGLYLGNLNATFTNMHRIPWPTVTITSGQTITLNEFFSGTSSYKTVVQPTSTTNYTITFTDNLERFARNVKISRATLTRPDQLTVITDKGNNGNNVGVKFYSNQMPNGIAKNSPNVNPEMALSTGGLMTDPGFV